MRVCATVCVRTVRVRLTPHAKSATLSLRENRERRVVGGDLSPAGDRVLIEISGGVADVRLNRPDKLNALDGAMFEAIVAAGTRLRRERGLRAVVLSGAGRGFCAGLGRATLPSLA